MFGKVLPLLLFFFFHRLELVAGAATFVSDDLGPASTLGTLLAFEEGVNIATCASMCTRYSWETKKTGTILSDPAAVFCGAYRYVSSYSPYLKASWIGCVLRVPALSSGGSRIVPRS